MLKSRTALWLLLAGLVPTALAYNALGLYCLVFDTGFSFPTDLRVRWGEQSILYRGVGLETGAPSHRATGEAVVPGHRTMSYPPWSFATNWLLIPPLGWQQVRVYYALLNLLALALIGYWGYHETAAWGGLVGLVGSASLLAIFPISICLSYGQYGVLVTGLLVACLLLCEKGWDYTAGLCLGMALVKPQLAGLFVLGLLVKGRVKVALTAAVYLVVASCITGALAGSNPVALFAKVSQEAREYYHASHNPLIVALVPAIGHRQATLLLAGLGSAMCAGLVWRYGRPGGLLTTFSICAVISMFWSYRRHYDTELLAFLFLALLVQACRTRSPLAAGTFLVFGLTLWAPVRVAQWEMAAVQYGYAALWIFGLGVLLVLTKGWASRGETCKAEEVHLAALRRC